MENPTLVGIRDPQFQTGCNPCKEWFTLKNALTFHIAEDFFMSSNVQNELCAIVNPVRSPIEDTPWTWISSLVSAKTMPPIIAFMIAFLS